jgi:hypothetical protein
VSVSFVIKWGLVFFIIFNISCTQPPEDKPIKNTSPEKTKTLAKKIPIRLKHVTGDIISIDTTKKMITIKSHQSEVELSTDDTTIIKIDGEEKSIADAMIGTRATVIYSEAEGNYIAKRIFITSKYVEKASAPVLKEEKSNN